MIFYQPARLGLATEHPRPHSDCRAELTLRTHRMQRCTLPKHGARRTRTIPVPAQVTARGSCDYFDESDVPTLAERLRQPPIVAASRVVARLNSLSEDFLIRYAAHKVPTPDSKTSEWCSALERDVEALMETLGVPDKGFPEDLMNVQV